MSHNKHTRNEWQDALTTGWVEFGPLHLTKISWIEFTFVLKNVVYTFFCASEGLFRNGLVLNYSKDQDAHFQIETPPRLPKTPAGKIFLPE